MVVQKVINRILGDVGRNKKYIRGGIVYDTSVPYDLMDEDNNKENKAIYMSARGKKKIYNGV